jgi:hypothetical protein
MTKRPFTICALAAALILDGPVLTADHGSHGNKHQQGNKHGDNDQGWEQKGGYQYQIYSGDARPPGWSQGKKTGWGNCGMPPGQAKKCGCRTYTYQGRPYFYFQKPDGRMVVRRPTIEVHGSVDIVH